MKKKLLIASLLIGLSLSIYGCGNTNMSGKETEADGTSVEHKDSGDIYCIEGLPRNLVYDGKEITVKSITFYEDKVDHAYSLYALVDFDMSGLTEDDIYWLGKDNDLEVIVYVDDEENEFDNERLSLLRTVQLPDGTYRFAFQMRGSYRYSLCGKSSDLVVYVTQGGKYKYKNKDGEITELDKKDIYYYFGCPIPEELESSDAIDEFTQNAMVEGFQNQLEIYQDIYDDLD